MSAHRLIGIITLLGASCALARQPEASGGPWEARLGLSARPLLAVSAVSLYRMPTLRDGGWVSVDVAPAYRFSRLFAAELGVSAMIPVRDAWGFPDFRLALTPAVRFDMGPVYARLGVPLMFGEGFRYGYQGAAGVTFLDHFYAGVVAEAIPEDLLGGLGLELGVRFGGL